MVSKTVHSTLKRLFCVTVGDSTKKTVPRKLVTHTSVNRSWRTLASVIWSKKLPLPPENGRLMINNVRYEVWKWNSRFDPVIWCNENTSTVWLLQSDWKHCWYRVRTLQKPSRRSEGYHIFGGVVMEAFLQNCIIYTTVMDSRKAVATSDWGRKLMRGKA